MNVLRLAVRRGDQRFEIDVAPGCHVGSSPHAELRLPDDSIAAVAARLDRREQWELWAYTAGVAVAGVAAPRDRAVLVVAGARVAIGDWELEILGEVVAAAPSPPQRTASIARELVREMLGGPGGVAPELICEAGPDGGQHFRLPPPVVRVVIGRGDGAGVSLGDPEVSRGHAAIDRGWEGTFVVDLGSATGTRVGGSKAPTQAPGVLLRDGDVIAVGATRLRYRDPAEQFLRQLGAVDQGGSDRPVDEDGEGAPSLLPMIAAGVLVALAVAGLGWLVL